MPCSLDSLLCFWFTPQCWDALPACCACGLKVQAGRAVSDLRPLSCLTHLLLLQIQLQSRAACIFASAQWETQPGTVPCTRSLLPWKAAGGDFPLWTVRMQRGRELQCVLQPAVLQRSALTGSAVPCSAHSRGAVWLPALHSRCLFSRCAFKTRITL